MQGDVNMGFIAQTTLWAIFGTQPIVGQKFYRRFVPNSFLVVTT